VAQYLPLLAMLVLATVFAGGVQDVEAGGLAIDTVLDDHDSQVVFSGGIAIGTVVSGTDSQVVQSGGIASNTVISGGTLDVQAGGIVSGAVTFHGSGGTYQIDGAAIPGALVSGFVSGDSFVLNGITFDPSGHVDLVNSGAVHNQLQISENGSTYDINLDPAQDFTGDYFHLVTNVSAGTVVTEDTTPCYCPGTLILTPDGEVPVEELKIGDRVVTLSGEARPIEWIGRRSYAGQFVLGRDDILPVCITAGALGEGIPRRDLWVSPNHALYLGGVLIEAKDLVNGASVYRAEEVESVEYFHLELASHDVIFAEGAAAESFIDDDNRGLFHNAPEYWAEHPEPAAGPAVLRAALRGRLRRRAGAGADRRARRIVRRGRDGPDRHVARAYRPDRPPHHRLGSGRDLSSGVRVPRHLCRQRAAGAGRGEPLPRRSRSGRLWRRPARLRVRAA